MQDLARFLVILGVFCVFLGVALFFMPRIPFLGNLPGDIHIKKENFSFYFPLTTCIVLSVILSLVFWLFSRR